MTALRKSDSRFLSCGHVVCLGNTGCSLRLLGVLQSSVPNERQKKGIVFLVLWELWRVSRACSSTAEGIPQSPPTGPSMYCSEKRGAFLPILLYPVEIQKFLTWQDFSLEFSYLWALSHVTNETGEMTQQLKSWALLLDDQYSVLRTRRVAHEQRKLHF